MAIGIEVLLVESQREGLFKARVRHLAILADIALAVVATGALVWLLIIGAPLSADALADGDRSGFVPLDAIVGLAVGAPTVWMLIAAVILLLRRWKFAWLAHWIALFAAAVFGFLAVPMLVPNLH